MTGGFQVELIGCLAMICGCRSLAILRPYIFLLPCQIIARPIIVDFQSRKYGGGRPFIFLNVLAKHEQFQQCVSEAWQQDVVGVPMYQIWTKLKQVKQALKLLHKNHFANTDQKVDEARSKLAQVQIDLQNDSLNGSLHQREQMCIEELRHWLKVEWNFREKRGPPPAGSLWMASIEKGLLHPLNRIPLFIRNRPFWPSLVYFRSPCQSPVGATGDKILTHSKRGLIFQSLEV